MNSYKITKLYHPYMYDFQHFNVKMSKPEGKNLKVLESLSFLNILLAFITFIHYIYIVLTLKQMKCWNIWCSCFFIMNNFVNIGFSSLHPKPNNFLNMWILNQIKPEAIRTNIVILLVKDIGKKALNHFPLIDLTFKNHSGQTIFIRWVVAVPLSQSLHISHSNGRCEISMSSLC